MGGAPCAVKRHFDPLSEEVEVEKPHPRVDLRPVESLISPWGLRIRLFAPAALAPEPPAQQLRTGQTDRKRNLRTRAAPAVVVVAKTRWTPCGCGSVAPLRGASRSRRLAISRSRNGRSRLRP